MCVCVCVCVSVCEGVGMKVRVSGYVCVGVIKISKNFPSVLIEMDVEMDVHIRH